MQPLSVKAYLAVENDGHSLEDCNARSSALMYISEMDSSLLLLSKEIPLVVDLHDRQHFDNNA